MATQLLPHSRVWNDEFGPAIEFLAQFGIAPAELHDYREEDVLKAIRARGWEVTVQSVSDPPGWSLAEITEWRSPTQSQTAVARDSDQLMAVFRALRIALTWPTKEDDAKAFDDLARSLLNVSAPEFLEKWRRDELDLKDPRVVHLLVARPVGW
jgi:hypothetical protein